MSRVLKTYGLWLGGLCAVVLFFSARIANEYSFTNWKDSFAEESRNAFYPHLGGEKVVKGHNNEYDPLENDFASLRLRFFSCEGCFVGFPKCSVPIHKSLDYLPAADDLVPVDRSMMDRVSHAFKDYLCMLPTFEPTSATSQCNFLRTMDNIFCDITVAKMFKLWGFTILRHSIGLGKIEGQQKRFVFRKKDLTKWKWLPVSATCPDEQNGWVVADVCPATKGSYLSAELAELIETNFADLGRLTYYAPTASSSILFQGLAIRHLLDHHLGACLQNMVAKYLSSKKTYYPRYPDGSKKRLCCPEEGLNKTVGGPVISLHIRRGDACERWKDKRGYQGDPRPCFTTPLYMKYALRMRELYGACRIRLATDSQDVHNELQKVANDYDFEITVLRFERAIFKPPIVGQKGFIENRVYQPEEVNLITASAIADLIFLAQGDVLIGNGAATITRVAHQTMAAYSGRVPPFVSIDRPLSIYAREKCAFARWR